jgi:hypothetical protein
VIFGGFKLGTTITPWGEYGAGINTYPGEYGAGINTYPGDMVGDEEK